MIDRRQFSLASAAALATAALPQVAHADGRVNSGDVSIFYRQFGRPGKTPMVMMHGANYFDSFDWINVATQLAADREVVATRGVSPVTLVGLEFRSLVSGAVVVEVVFSWPGVGRFLYESAQAYDFTSVMGVTAFVGIMRSEEHTSETPVTDQSRMPSSA